MRAIRAERKQILTHLTASVPRRRNKQYWISSKQKITRLVTHDTAAYGVPVMNTFNFRTTSTLIAFTILFCTLLSSSTKAQTANNPPLTLNPADTDEVIRLFTTLKSSELPTWLHSHLSEPIPSQSNKDSFARATWLAQLNIVQDEPTCDRLKEQAAPILKLFGRYNTVRFFLYYDSYPNLQTIAGSYLGVSTGLLHLLKRDSPNNAQFIGLVAHELARGIQKEGFLTAWKNEDFQALRAFELFYDAVATATLIHLHLPSQQYALILQRMIAQTNANSTKHPDLQQRQSVIRKIALTQPPTIEINTKLH